MARARNIKPGFFRNADLAEMSFEARLLFIGLWTLADRDGRLEDRPKQIKMELFPADNLDCNGLLSDLCSSGMVKRYEVEGKRYVHVVNFLKHQNPHRDEKASTIPDEFGNCAEKAPAPKKHSASTVQAQCQHDADSVSIRLNPDPLIPDSLIPESKVKKDKEPRKRDTPTALVKPDDVDQQTWGDWQALRKAKRAPVTETVVAGARREAEKAGMTLEDFLQVWCRRGSQGLEALWLKPEERAGKSPRGGKYDAAAAAIFDGVFNSPFTGDTFDA